ncbi:hypothetical protein KI387_013610, partial [Taxus chinensis]
MLLKKDIENNVVFVSRNYFSIDKRRRIFRVGSLNWTLGALPENFDKLQCKVRHGPELYDCDFELVKGNLSKEKESLFVGETTKNVAVVRLTEDDQGIAAGQFAAFYKENICLGSGVIINSCGDHSFPVCSKALEIARLKDKSELREPVKIKTYDNPCARKSKNIGYWSNPGNSVDRSLVKWHPPESNWFKLNFDGASKGNPGTAAGGGAIRDHKGNLIVAYAGKMGIQTNHFAEALSVLWGLRVARAQNIQNLIVEGDSLNIINLLNQSSSPSWNIKDFISESISISHTFNSIRIIHTYREGNKLADAMANYGININFTIWDNDSIPNQLHNSIHADLHTQTISKDML